ncbi:MAG TPA: M23 family metallopeptidase [Gemmatimonadaceae bacterium]|nr:M23 family metallopeptidase [Gemmatimonadaceae bacterium]
MSASTDTRARPVVADAVGRRRGAYAALVILQHIGVPLVMAVLIAAGPRADGTFWWTMVWIAVAYTAFVLRVGAWYWFGDLARAGVGAIVAAGAVMGSHAAIVRGLPVGGWQLALGPLIAAPLVAMLALAWRARPMPPAAFACTFPLRGGTFHVAQGGAGKVVNYHYPHGAQRYALDIVRVNASGRRARGAYPNQLDAYFAVGATVVSPCDGVVIAAHDGMPDHDPPARDRDNPPGNYVAIRSADVAFLLAHLMRGSIAVRVGEQVRAGQPVARVGNSGNGTEPHLHVHAERGARGALSTGTGVPLEFDDRCLVRNDRVRA